MFMSFLWLLVITACLVQPSSFVQAITFMSIFTFIICSTVETTFSYISVYLFVGDLLVLLLIASCGVLIKTEKGAPHTVLILLAFCLSSISEGSYLFSATFTPFSSFVCVLMNLLVLGVSVGFVSYMTEDSLSKLMYTPTWALKALTPSSSGMMGNDTFPLQEGCSM